MLEQLDAIDWKSYGAEYMPASIKGLASSDLKVFGDAWTQLEWILAPSEQGAPENYDAFEIQKHLEAGIPMLVTPFLVELLQGQSVLLKDWILELLCDLSFYPQLKLQTELSQKQAHQVFELVKEGMPVYQSLLKDGNSQVRKSAEQVIKCLET